MTNSRSISTSPQTSATQLRSLIKSARDIMRKDKGLNGDLDRLPMLTWVMFLKFLDDMELLRETEALLSSERFRPLLDPPYRWRDWAASEGGITGDDLIAFVNNDKAMRPDGNSGAGLFAALRSLQNENGDSRRTVVANVFRGVINRMINGYLLRDVLNLVNGIHFNSSEEIHTLGHLYETLLREMRDAAGDSGEFYTPRPVVQLMVAVTNPRLGESVLDPACGTGGFLVEAYNHLQKQCQTVDDRRILQEESIAGGEAKPLPYLLAQMNLLLHGLESPNILYGNSLIKPLHEIGDSERVDLILTNPPFGGEEERGILGNFPEDKQTAETTLLFLQLIMRKLKRPGRGSGGGSGRGSQAGRVQNGGRAAVVVPNGTLFADGVLPASKKNCSKSSTCTQLCVCPTASLPPTPASPPTCSFLNAAGRRVKSGFTNSHCRPVAKATPKPNQSRSKSLHRCKRGGMSGWRMNRLGACRWVMCLSMMTRAICSR